MKKIFVLLTLIMSFVWIGCQQPTTIIDEGGSTIEQSGGNGDGNDSNENNNTENNNENDNGNDSNENNNNENNNGNNNTENNNENGNENTNSVILTYDKTEYTFKINNIASENSDWNNNKSYIDYNTRDSNNYNITIRIILKLQNDVLNVSTNNKNTTIDNVIINNEEKEIIINISF